MRRVVAWLVACGAGLLPVQAQSASFFHIPDVATDLSGETFLPTEIVRFDGTASAYTSTLLLPGAPPVDALHRTPGGDWLLSVAIPTDLDGVTYDARDVIRFDGSGYSLELDGAAAGIPDTSNVDALAMEGDDLLIGFDVPTTIGGVPYDRNDLARYAGGSFTLFFDASLAGVPATSDVVGAAREGGSTLLTFDIATDLDGSTYLAGQLVAWDGLAFAIRHQDPGWPATSVMRGIAVETGGGGPGALGDTLRIDRAPGGAIELSWGSSCSAGASDYAIYEGEIGDWYSHEMADCDDDGGDRREIVAPQPGNRYFLVVPQEGGANEGSYGRDANDIERPPAPGACAPQVASTC